MRAGGKQFYVGGLHGRSSWRAGFMFLFCPQTWWNFGWPRKVGSLAESGRAPGVGKGDGGGRAFMPSRSWSSRTYVVGQFGMQQDGVQALGARGPARIRVQPL